MTTGPFSAPVTAIRLAVTRALEEDLTPLGDITSALLPAGARAEARFVDPRPTACWPGPTAAPRPSRQIDPAVECRWDAADGDAVDAGQVLGTVAGPLASVLTAERTALNFLCHLSGVATLTRRFVDAAGSDDPGVGHPQDHPRAPRRWRRRRCGPAAAANHRGNLSEWVMFKDNHLTLLGIAEAVAAARAAYPGKLVHVECDTVDKLREALEAGADAVLLDNMEPDEARRCVELADEHAAAAGVRRPLVELSGGITLETVRRFADVGADLVSSGALTNSAPVLDIGLDIESGRRNWRD